MKKRSEVIAAKRKAEADSMPLSVKVMHCAACKVVSPMAGPKRNDGKLECPECGAAIDPDDVADTSTAGTESIPSKKEAARPPIETEPLPQMYCSKCGAAWPRVEGRPFPNCGHTEGMVDDPKKAEHWNPPAGHPRPPAEFDPKRPPQSEGELPIPVTTPMRVTGNRIEADWGKMVFKLDGFGVNMSVGPFVGSIEVPEGGDRVVAGAKLLKDLKALADTAFTEQLSWYIQKLGVIAKKLDG